MARRSYQRCSQHVSTPPPLPRYKPSPHRQWQQKLTPKRPLPLHFDSFWSFSAPWSDMIALQRKMTNEFIPELKALTPGSGVYLNEADFLEADWKESFYGVNYARLRSIKKKYDRREVFYAPTAVGSDEWKEDSRGRLCRV